MAASRGQLSNELPPTWNLAYPYLFVTPRERLFYTGTAMAQGLDASDPRWWSLAVAIVALAQPWAIASYKRWFRRGSVDIYEIGTIEVGFGYFGPTIGMIGTLRAVHHDMFVRNIGVEVVRLQDGSHHSFDWITFRYGRINLAGAVQDAAIEAPSSFLLTTAQPFRYNIVFSDVSTMGTIADIIRNANTEWNKLLVGSGLYISDPKLSQTQAISQVINQLRTDFSASSVANESFLDLSRRNYWEPGNYRLTMHVETTRPDVVISKTWNFALTDGDARLIRANIGSIVASVTGTVEQYNIAYSKYLPSM